MIKITNECEEWEKAIVSFAQRSKDEKRKKNYVVIVVFAIYYSDASIYEMGNRENVFTSIRCGIYKVVVMATIIVVWNERARLFGHNVRERRNHQYIRIVGYRVEQKCIRLGISIVWKFAYHEFFCLQALRYVRTGWNVRRRDMLRLAHSRPSCTVGMVYEPDNYYQVYKDVILRNINRIYSEIIANIRDLSSILIPQKCTYEELLNEAARCTRYTIPPVYESIFEFVT